jgi:nitrile hydratase accessory protein
MGPGNRPAVPLDGPLALPRRNGEIIFDAPWQSRVFGMAAVLESDGRWTWGEFAEHFHLPDEPESSEEYYERWLASLESLLIDRRLLTDEELDARTAEFEAGFFDHH